jgi:cell division protease FtsH
VIAGPERKSRVINQREKELTAYHEAGHALVAYLLPDAEPVAKVSIISRGSMGGYTRMSPEEDRNLLTKKQLEARLAVASGGRVAEELIFDEITTGASNDFEQATQLARTMVTRYGMSKELGPRTFGKREELVFLGKEISEHADYSDRVAQAIDEEVRGLIDKAYQTASNILTTNKDKLSQVAKYLIDNESVEDEALKGLFDSPPPGFPDAAPAG